MSAVCTGFAAHYADIGVAGIDIVRLHNLAFKLLVVHIEAIVGDGNYYVVAAGGDCPRLARLHYVEKPGFVLVVDVGVVDVADEAFFKQCVRESKFYICKFFQTVNPLFPFAVRHLDLEQFYCGVAEYDARFVAVFVVELSGKFLHVRAFGEGYVHLVGEDAAFAGVVGVHYDFGGVDGRHYGIVMDWKFWNVCILLIVRVVAIVIYIIATTLPHKKNYRSH